MKVSSVLVLSAVVGASLLVGGIISKATASADTACSPSLAFQKTGDDMYVLTAQNNGGATCTGARLSLYYADNESFVSSSPKPTAYGYYWDLKSLAAGKSVGIELVTKTSGALADDAAVPVDNACLSADNGSDACATATAGGGAAAAAPVAPSPAPRSALAAPAAAAASNATTPTTASPMPAPVPAITPLLNLVQKLSPASAPAIPAKTAAVAQVSSAQESGVWEWTNPSEMTAAKMQQDVDEAAAGGFNAIYLSIDDYWTNDENLAKYDALISSFIGLANAKGIAVDAEAGWRDWGTPANRWQAYAIMNFVNSYNSTHPATAFRGVQYDIEPYLLTTYATNEAGVLTDYAGLVEGLVAQDNSYTTPLPLGMVIPHFYDPVVAWTPKITIDGVSDYVYDQIIAQLNKLPAGDARVLVMAYRNFTAGTNGTIALSATEVHIADVKNVKVIIGQETGPVTPTYITYFGLANGLSTLNANLAAISMAFAGDASYAGTAIDYLDEYAKLK